MLRQQRRQARPTGDPMPNFYRPADDFVGDAIPFYGDGLFHAF